MHVYRAIRAQKTKHLLEKHNSGDANEAISPISSQDRMIIICKSIDDKYEELARYGTFDRELIATETCIPVTPLIASPDSEFTTTEEWSQVSFQHVTDYDYTTMCNRQAVMDFQQENIKQQEELKLKQAKEEEHRKEKNQESMGGSWLLVRKRKQDSH